MDEIGQAASQKASRWVAFRPSGPLVVSVVALMTSQLSCFLALRTHSLTQRPYVGIVEANAHIHPQPECKDGGSISWKIKFKNVGPTQVRMVVHEHRLSMFQGKDTHFDHNPGPGNMVVLMPQAENALEGLLTCETDQTPEAQHCRALLCHVRHRTANAVLTVRLSYLGPGWLWGTRTYKYEAQLSYDPPPHEGLKPLWTSAD